MASGLAVNTTARVFQKSGPGSQVAKDRGILAWTIARADRRSWREDMPASAWHGC